MKELAMQELKILEVEHPTKFQYLKLQLTEFIRVLDEQDQQQQQILQQDHCHNDSSVVTQESSNRKRVREGSNDESGYNKRSTSAQGIRDDTDAIQKAKACLRKIQTLKSFFSSVNH